MTYINHEIITTIGLVDIHYLIYIQNKRNRKKMFFFLWWEGLGFTLLTFIYNQSVNYIYHVVHHTPKVLVYLIIRSLYLLTVFNQFSLLYPTHFIFFGSEITADGDCSHETKRCLLLGRKVMTNLLNIDNILKSRDITLPTKVHLVKAMVFPIVMYG